MKTRPLANRSMLRGVWQLDGENGSSRPVGWPMQELMQELVLPQPGPLAHAAERELLAQESRQQLEALLAEAMPLAFRVARAVLRNSADAEDVAQEALLRAYRRWDRLRDRTRFRGWLVRIAFRLALDRVRSAKRRTVRETLWSQTAPRPSVEDLAAGSEFQYQLEVALAELPEKFRLALVLSAMEGHTTEEVATLLNLPLGTVKSRIFSARRRLAEKLRCYVNNSSPR